MRPAALRDVNQKYLDALRRALEQADGLEQVFESFFPLNQQGLGQNAIGGKCHKTDQIPAILFGGLRAAFLFK